MENTNNLIDKPNKQDKSQEQHALEMDKKAKLLAKIHEKASIKNQ